MEEKKAGEPRTKVRLEERMVDLISPIPNGKSIQLPLGRYDDYQKGIVVEIVRFVCRLNPALARNVEKELENFSVNNLELVIKKINEAKKEAGMKGFNKEYSEWFQPSCTYKIALDILTWAQNLSVPDPTKLNTHYTAFSSETYGETNYEQAHNILDELKLGPNDVFADLGAGIGNVVLLAAAVSKCKRVVGIEIAKVPYECSQKMRQNFIKLMDFFGMEYRPFELFHGDMLDPNYRDLITREATAMFTNNFAFDSSLDTKIKHELIADMADGVRIISTRKYADGVRELNARKMGDVESILEVEELSLKSGESNVSWTHKPVPFYLHTVSRAKMAAFFESRLDRNRLKKKTSSNSSREGSSPDVRKQSDSREPRPEPILEKEAKQSLKTDQKEPKESKQKREDSREPGNEKDAKVTVKTEPKEAKSTCSSSSFDFFDETAIRGATTRRMWKAQTCSNSSGTSNSIQKEVKIEVKEEYAPPKKQKKTSSGHPRLTSPATTTPAEKKKMTKVTVKDGSRSAYKAHNHPAPRSETTPTPLNHLQDQVQVNNNPPAPANNVASMTSSSVTSPPTVAQFVHHQQQHRPSSAEQQLISQLHASETTDVPDDAASSINHLYQHTQAAVVHQVGQNEEAIASSGLITAPIHRSLDVNERNRPTFMLPPTDPLYDFIVGCYVHFKGFQSRIVNADPDLVAGIRMDIEHERARQLELIERIAEMERQVDQKRQEGVVHLKERLVELDMGEVQEVSELLHGSKQIVAQHKELTQLVSKLEALNAIEEAKLREKGPLGDRLVEHLHEIPDQETNGDRYAIYIQNTCGTSLQFNIGPIDHPEDTTVVSPGGTSSTAPRKNRQRQRTGAGGRRGARVEEANEQQAEEIAQFVQMALQVDNAAKDRERRARGSGGTERTTGRRTNSSQAAILAATATSISTSVPSSTHMPIFHTVQFHNPP